MIWHSLEGSMSPALAILQGPAPKSWHFTLPKRGTGFYQHYPIYKVAWHGGGLGANRRFFGVETEGVAGEPLTDHQLECGVDVMTWAAENDVLPWPGFARWDTLHEHNEMTRYGSAPTACPSGRIPWQEEVDMANLIEGLTRRVDAAENERRKLAEILQSVAQRVTDGENQGTFLCGLAVDHEGRIKELEASY